MHSEHKRIFLWPKNNKHKVEGKPCWLTQKDKTLIDAVSKWISNNSYASSADINPDKNSNKGKQIPTINIWENGIQISIF